ENFLCHSVHAYRGLRCQCAERSHAADAVPRIAVTRFLALALVPLQKSGNECLASQRGQSDPPGLSESDYLIGVVKRTDFDDRARLRCVVRNRVAVLGSHRPRTRETHQCVAICRSQIHAGPEQFLDCKTRILRSEFGTPGEYSSDTRFSDGSTTIGKFLGQRLEQLWGSKHATYIVPGAQDSDRLIDYVRLILVEHFGLAPLNQLDHPSRIEIDAEADAASVLTKMFNRKPEPSRSGRSQHQPVRALREILFGQSVAEHLVVGAKVFKLQAALGHTGAPAGLKGKDWFAGDPFWQPPPHRTAAQPLILKRRKSCQILKRFDFASRVPAETFCKTEPEGTARIRIEMPLDDLTDMRVEN